MRQLSISRSVLLIIGLLTSFGLIAIYAASSLKGAQQFHDEFLFLRKQALAAILGGCLIWLIQVAPLRWLERATLPVLVFVLALLSLIFVPGMYTKVGGASRWLNLPIIGGQPAELAKLGIVLFLAKNLSRKKNDVQSVSRGILPNFIVLGIVSGLLLLQKDLGTPVLLFLVTFTMLFAAGITRGFIIYALLAFFVCITIAVTLEPYRMARILSFLDPWAQIKGSGFQIIQSFVAFSNGGLFGVGLGESKQKLFFLPEAHTDFVLAVIGEEMGLVGVLTVVFSLLGLTALGYKTAFEQPSPYRQFLAFGLSTLLGMEALLNMGVVMGLLPTKGMPLPFVSSGNSSLLVFMVVGGILAKLAANSTASDPKPSQAAVNHSSGRT